MTETWFTSDSHLGHKKILEYEKEFRNFETIEEMNEKIIDNWNRTVAKKDIIYHLGDFAFGGINVASASRLHGDKRIILGNHDHHRIDLYLRHFQRIFGAHHWQRCILTHVPVHPATLGSRYLLNVHGHLHSKTIKDERGFPHEWSDDLRYFNVCVERHNLTPVHSSVILDRLKDIKG